MKATDFNLSRDLQFSLETGITTFKDSRLVIFDTNAIGFLRQKLIEKIGLDAARDFFLQFGFQNGISDFMQMKLNYEFDSEMDLLASGPVIHTWEGVVHAAPKEVRIDKNAGEFFFTGVWSNSYEAEQHLTYNDISNEPVCWSLMGYAAGWCTGFFGKKIICVEPVCAGKGDDHCEWMLKPEDEWDDSASNYINALREF